MADIAQMTWQRYQLKIIKQHLLLGVQHVVQQNLDLFLFIGFFKKKNEEVILQPSWQNSPEHRGKSIQEKSTLQDIATVAPEHD